MLIIPKQNPIVREKLVQNLVDARRLVLSLENEVQDFDNGAKTQPGVYLAKCHKEPKIVRVVVVPHDNRRACAYALDGDVCRDGTWDELTQIYDLIIKLEDSDINPREEDECRYYLN